MSPTWNWKPGVKLTGIGPAAWWMGLNLQSMCQPSRSPCWPITSSPDLCWESAPFCVLKLGQDAEEGKIFLEKMIFDFTDWTWKQGMNAPWFFWQKIRRAWQMSQSSTVDGILYEEASSQVWQSKARHKERSVSNWRIFKCNSCSYNGTKSLSAIPSPWNVYCSRHLSVCPQRKIERQAGDRLLERVRTAVVKPWVCPIITQMYHIPTYSKVHCVRWFFSCFNHIQNLPLLSELKGNPVGWTTRSACIMPCPFSPACQMIWGAFMKPQKTTEKSASTSRLIPSIHNFKSKAYHWHLQTEMWSSRSSLREPSVLGNDPEVLGLWNTM